MFKNDIDILAKQIMSATGMSRAAAVKEAKSRLTVEFGGVIRSFSEYNSEAKEWLELMFRLHPYVISTGEELVWKASFGYGLMIGLGARIFMEDASDVFSSLYFCEPGRDLMDKRDYNYWNEGEAWQTSCSPRELDGVMIGPDAYGRAHTPLVGTVLDLREVQPAKKADMIVKFLNSKFK